MNAITQSLTTRPTSSCPFASSLQALPGPVGLPFFGVARELNRDPLRYFIQLLLKFGDAVRFEVGKNRVVMLSNPDAVQHVLQDNNANYIKSRLYDPLQPILGGGVFLAQGQEWASQRRVVKPAFDTQRYEQMAHDVADATAAMLGRWQDNPDGVVNFGEEMARVTLEGVSRAILGFDAAADFRVISQALGIILKEAESRIWSPVQMPDFIRRLVNPSYRKALRTLDDLVANLAATHKNTKDSQTLIGMLIQAYGGKNPKLLRDQLVSMIASGHETTAISLTWAFTLLSRHPHIHRRLETEVDQVLNGRVPTFADLKDLPYVRMVFEESMRLYPPIWTISREALADDQISEGVKIAKGTTVMLSAYALHRHPDLWDNPEGFDPERFAPGEAEKRHRFAYIPFGGGPRKCLGDRFAMMEAQIMMTMIVQRFRPSLEAGCSVTPKPTISLRPEGPVLMRLEQRR